MSKHVKILFVVLTTVPWLLLFITMSSELLDDDVVMHLVACRPGDPTLRKQEENFLGYGLSGQIVDPKYSILFLCFFLAVWSMFPLRPQC